MIFLRSALTPFLSPPPFQFADGVFFRAVLPGGDAGHRRRRMGVDDASPSQRRPRLHVQHGGTDRRIFSRQRRLSRLGVGRFLECILEKRTSARRHRHAGGVSALLGDRLLNHNDSDHDFQG